MNSLAYIPITEYLETSKMRSDIYNTLSPLLDNFAYIDSTIRGDTSEGIFYYRFEIIHGVFLPLPLTKGLGLQLGEGFGEIGITFYKPHQFEATLWLDVIKLQIPRNVLIPAVQNQNGETVPDENEDHHVLINLPVGLQVDENLDFDLIFPGSDLGSLSLPESYIGKTGIKISVSNVELDLSSTSNIPPATTDGRTTNFVGVFFQSASATLPSIFTPASGSTTTIEGHNVLIGTGGISGTVELADSSGFVRYSLGNFDLEINAFSLSFKMNTITGSSIAGALTIPGFKKNNTNDSATVAIQAAFDTHGNFKITADTSQLLDDIGIKDVFTVSITRLTVEKDPDSFYVELAGSLDLIADIPVLGSVLPKGIEIDSLRIYDDGSFEFVGIKPDEKGRQINFQNAA